jgi:hypothetical protein
MNGRSGELGSAYEAKYTKAEVIAMVDEFLTPERVCKLYAQPFVNSRDFTSDSKEPVTEVVAERLLENINIIESDLSGVAKESKFSHGEDKYIDTYERQYYRSASADELEACTLLGRTYKGMGKIIGYKIPRNGEIILLSYNKNTNRAFIIADNDPYIIEYLPYQPRDKVSLLAAVLEAYTHWRATDINELRYNFDEIKHAAEVCRAVMTTDSVDYYSNYGNEHIIKLIAELQVDLFFMGYDESLRYISYEETAKEVKPVFSKNTDIKPCRLHITRSDSIYCGSSTDAVIYNGRVYVPSLREKTGSSSGNDKTDEYGRYVDDYRYRVCPALTVDGVYLYDDLVYMVAYTYESDSLMQLEVNGKWGYCDLLTGEIAIKPQWDFAGYFENFADKRFARVSNGCRQTDYFDMDSFCGGKWEMINENGAVVIPLDDWNWVQFYPHVGSLYNSGCWIACKTIEQNEADKLIAKDEYTILNLDGDIMISGLSACKGGSDYTQEYLRIKRDGKYGVMGPIGDGESEVYGIIAEPMLEYGEAKSFIKLKAKERKERWKWNR